MRLSNHSELFALLATLPSKAPIHKGTVPANPTFPYVLVQHFLPKAADRSLNRTIHARSERWRVTVAGQTEDSVWVVSAQVSAALEGARIGGQRVEEIPNSLPILEDLDVTLSNGRHPFYLVTEWQVMH